MKTRLIEPQSNRRTKGLHRLVALILGRFIKTLSNGAAKILPIYI
jgi:hypothetical protein